MPQSWPALKRGLPLERGPRTPPPMQPRMHPMPKWQGQPKRQRLDAQKKQLKLKEQPPAGRPVCQCTEAAAGSATGAAAAEPRSVQALRAEARRLEMQRKSILQEAGLRSKLYKLPAQGRLSSYGARQQEEEEEEEEEDVKVEMEEEEEEEEQPPAPGTPGIVEIVLHYAKLAARAARFGGWQPQAPREWRW